MSKKASKSVIGAFLVGALVLAVAGLLVFGGGKFLTKTYPYIMYFEGSVKGLSVGSEVVIRGVKVGSVQSIAVRANPKDFSVRIPVVIEMEPDKIEMEEAERARDPYKNLPRLIEHGLRAQLQTKSLVTGQLQIALDYHPNEAARLVGGGKYPEIPTISTTLEKFSQELEDLPLTEMAHRLSASLAGIEKVVNSPEISETLHDVRLAAGAARKLLENLDSSIEPLMTDIGETVKETQKLVRNVDGQIEPLTSNSNAALTAARRAFVQGEKTLALKGGAPGELGASARGAIESIRKLSDAARPAIVELEKTLANAEALTKPDSAAGYQISNALKELTAAARSIRVWAEYLERHPEALIRGKGGTGRR
jgi:paraquat-inducible protein B